MTPLESGSVRTATGVVETPPEDTKGNLSDPLAPSASTTSAEHMHHADGK